MNHDTLMEAALEEARRARDGGEVPIGAVIAVGDEIVGCGFNQPVGSGDPTAHAEIVAIRDAAGRVGNYRLTGATLYVTIEPCTMCAGALIHARVDTPVFGAREPRAGAIVNSAAVIDNAGLNHRVAIVEGVLVVECQQLLKAFFRARCEAGASS